VSLVTGIDYNLGEQLKVAVELGVDHKLDGNFTLKWQHYVLNGTSQPSAKWYIKRKLQPSLELIYSSVRSINLILIKKIIYDP
jgi:hypothetical protein